MTFDNVDDASTFMLCRHVIIVAGTESFMNDGTYPSQKENIDPLKSALSQFHEGFSINARYGISI